MFLFVLASLALIFLFLYFIYLKFKSRDDQSSNSSGLNVEGEERIQPANIIGKEKIKLIPYQEALEVSKRFIFNIARIVMERFSVDAKQSLSDIGKTLMKAGVQYMHVVDVFSISLHKQLQRKAELKQNKAQSQQKSYRV